MTRINESQVQQQQQAQQANQARDTQAPPPDSERAFAARLKKQDENKPTQQPKNETSASATSAKDADSAKTRMLQNQSFSLSGRKGTVSDLQARLSAQEGAQGAKGKGLDAQKGAEAEALDAKGLDGKSIDGKSEGMGIGKELGAEGEMKLSIDGKPDLAVGMGGLQGGGQIQQGGQIATSATFEVRGAKIPTAMMEKMMDQARVGVNEVGAPEFQFDLKGDVLGGMKMRISMENGQLKAIFVAENSDIRKFMDGNLKDLERNLQDRGIFIKDLQVRDPEEDRRQRQREQHQRDREEAMG